MKIFGGKMENIVENFSCKQDTGFAKSQIVISCWKTTIKSFLKINK